MRNAPEPLSATPFRLRSSITRPRDGTPPPPLGNPSIEPRTRPWHSQTRHQSTRPPRWEWSAPSCRLPRPTNLRAYDRRRRPPLVGLELYGRVRQGILLRNDLDRERQQLRQAFVRHLAVRPECGTRYPCRRHTRPLAVHTTSNHATARDSTGAGGQSGVRSREPLALVPCGRAVQRTPDQGGPRKWCDVPTYPFRNPKNCEGQ